MTSLQTRRDRGAGIATSIHDVLPVMILSIIQQSLNTGLSIAPSTSIKRLLLSPNDSFGIGVEIQIIPELLPREWVKLLDTSDSHIVNLLLSAILGQGCIDLAGT